MCQGDSTIATYICCKCGSEYPLTREYWHLSKGKKTGFVTKCKSCVQEYYSQYYLSRQEELRKRRKDHRHKNPEQYLRTNRKLTTASRERQREYGKQWYQANCERIKKKSRERYMANPAKHREMRQRWNKKNPDYSRQYYLRDKDNVRKRKQRWYKENPDKAKAYAHKRRALKLAAIGEFTKEDLQLAYHAQKGKCWHCSKHIGKKYHADHLIPLAKGGTNNPNNIVVSCAKCNSSKGAKYCWQWNGRLF